MRIRTLTVAIIGIGCVAAAAAAGYLAVRQNQADARLDKPAASRVADQPSAPAPAPAPAPDDVTTSPIVPTPPISSPAPSAVQPAGAGRPAAHPKISPRVEVPDAPAPLPEPTPPGNPDPIATRSVPTPADVPPPPVAVAPPPVAAAVDVPAFVPIAPDRPEYLELTIPAQSVIGIRLDTSVSTETAKVEDRVTARVTRDVTVSGHVVIPAGARLEGSVTTVEKGGKFKDHARLGVKFSTLFLGDSRVPLQTETIFRDDDSASSAAASKVGGGAVLGAILGAMLGGKKGAAIGGAAGAGAGTAAVATGAGNNATLAAGMNLTVQLSAPVTITVQKL